MLLSNGLSSDKLLRYVYDRTGGQGRAALVVTADNEYKANNRHVKRCIKELASQGLTVDIFDIDEQDPRLLLTYDAVELIGGNPYYLLDSIRKCGAEKVLFELADKKLLIGWSAGAFVLGPSLELANSYSPHLNFLGLTDLRAMAITDIEVLPHYSKFLKRIDRFEEICCEYEKTHNVKVVRLCDGDGVIIDGDKRHICRA